LVYFRLIDLSLTFFPPSPFQSYAETLRERNIVDADTIHNLFPALGKLTDFQRKLLIQMEATAERGLDEQDWGQCFVQHEPEFAIYDAYIANYSNALDVAVAEQQTLMVSEREREREPEEMVPFFLSFFLRCD